MNGPARTVTSEPPSDRSSTAFSAVRAGTGRAGELSSSDTGNTVSSSVSSCSSSGPSEGGVHGWWLAGECSSPSLSSH